MKKTSLLFIYLVISFLLIPIFSLAADFDVLVTEKNREPVELTVTSTLPIKKIYIYKKNTKNKYTLIMLVNAQEQKEKKINISINNLSYTDNTNLKIILEKVNSQINEKEITISKISQFRSPIPSTTIKTSKISSPKTTHKGMTTVKPSPPTPTPTNAKTTPTPSPTKSTPSASTSNKTQNSKLNISSGTTTHQYGRFKYYQVIPDNPTENMPLIVFLHGKGEGHSFSKLGKLPIVTYVSSKKAFNAGKFIFIAPKDTNNSWEKKSTEKELMKLIEKVSKEYKIDKNRIILTGMSQGGLGTWSTATRYPNYFAAIVPMSGYPNIKVKALTNTPIWAICGNSGGKEKELNSQNKKAVRKINKASGKNLAKFETINGATHGSVQKSYKRQSLFKWMLSKKQKINCIKKKVNKYLGDILLKKVKT